MTDRPARPDFVAVHIALARRALAGETIPLSEDDEPAQLFEPDAELAAAVERHPSNGPEEAA